VIAEVKKDLDDANEYEDELEIVIRPVSYLKWFSPFGSRSATVSHTPS
jgi:hypothetical protein